MANGDGNSVLTPVKTIMICIGITVAVNGWSLILNQKNESDIDKLRTELNAKTDKRYRQTDATRDFNLVMFRFERNEQKIRRCEKFIENHLREQEPTK